MEAWMKVVTHPLGLAGFALFLVFLVVGKTRSNDQKRWLGPAFVALSAVVLIGGLVLAYFQIANDAVSPPITIKPPSKKTQSAPSNQQTTHGDNSPAVSNVEGSVNITIHDSKTGKQEK